MKLNSQTIRYAGLLGLALCVLALSGCSLFAKKNSKSPMDPPEEGPAQSGRLARFHVGDVVLVTLSGLPEDILPMEKPIKDDGTISLPDIGRIMASGKTAGELEDAIHDLYVPKYYTHLNVTIKSTGDRVYYVRGEVKQPGRMIYTGPITVTKAITSAGDFTDFASRSDVMLIRVNSDRFKLNINRILAGKDPDPLVYPGDQIVVDRSIF